MERLTDQGWQKVLELAQRYGVSTDAVTSLLQSVANGGGTMAQFFHSELGGGGQWMQGGMTMVGDMFNHGLKAKVDALCSELSQLLQTRPFVPTPPPSYAQGGGQQQSQGGWGSSSSFFGSGSGSWWPSELGSPNGSGGQNNVRYAYFNQAHRLAVDAGGVVTVYDTLDHQIGGVQQQQGGSSSASFTSQYGTFDASSLPVISINGVSQQRSGAVNTNAYNPSPAPQYNPPPPPPVSSFTPLYAPAPSSSAPAGGSALETDVFAKIERLAELQQKGILSLEEFSAKKTELLSRL